jgi:hypothetical protein
MNRRRPVSLKLIPVVGMAITLTIAAPVATAQDARCLDNNGSYTVPTGTRYSDTNGEWVCEPEAPGATAGGWLRVLPATATPPVAVPTVPPPELPLPSARSDGDGAWPIGAPHALALVLGIAGGVSVFFAGVLLAVRRSRRRLTGYLEIDEVQRARA